MPGSSGHFSLRNWFLIRSEILNKRDFRRDSRIIRSASTLDMRIRESAVQKRINKNSKALTTHVLVPTSFLEEKEYWNTLRNSYLVGSIPLSSHMEELTCKRKSSSSTLRVKPEPKSSKGSMVTVSRRLASFLDSVSRS